MENTVAGPLLEVKDLHTYFYTREGVVKAINGVSLSLYQGQVLALVGESGSGKSMTALSILRLVPYPGRIVQGEIWFDGRRLADLNDREMRRIRGREISIVFQDASAALNPVLTIGTQMEEILLAHSDITKSKAREVCADLLWEMGLAEPRRLMEEYPFHLSGGMAQRVMLAMALAPQPRLLIADEPTSNLDVTLQAEILQRLRRLQKEQHASILLITHDMGVVAQMADTVAVMYAGSIMETGDTPSLFRHPTHPYTWGLFRALPRVDQQARSLTPIPGLPPDLIDLPDQCPFLPRCPKATVQCRINPRPPLEEVEPTHAAACYNRIRHED
jgi:oligopeptide/dipeptide ABC transporter ATP-binding protein